MARSGGSTEDADPHSLRVLVLASALSWEKVLCTQVSNILCFTISLCTSDCKNSVLKICASKDYGTEPW